MGQVMRKRVLCHSDDNDMKKNTSKSKAMFLASKYTAKKIMEEPPYLAKVNKSKYLNPKNC